MKGNAMHPLKHLKTVNNHRFLVMKYCFSVGLYYQGLTHDLSKYSLQEFSVGAKYFDSGRSPHVGERIEKGYSTAWLHHKGRNRHHFEYWIDYQMDDPGSREEIPRLVGLRMPPKYVVEMALDRIAASRIYNGAKYDDSKALEYYMRKDRYLLMHPDTRALLELILKKLSKRGEEYTLRFIRTRILTRGYEVLKKPGASGTGK